MHMTQLMRRFPTLARLLLTDTNREAVFNAAAIDGPQTATAAAAGCFADLTAHTIWDAGRRPSGRCRLDDSGLGEPSDSAPRAVHQEHKSTARMSSVS